MRQMTKEKPSKRVPDILAYGPGVPGDLSKAASLPKGLRHSRLSY
jgi:hypothetical protein